MRFVAPCYVLALLALTVNVQSILVSPKPRVAVTTITSATPCGTVVAQKTPKQATMSYYQGETLTVVVTETLVNTKVLSLTLIQYNQAATDNSTQIANMTLLDGLTLTTSPQTITLSVPGMFCNASSAPCALRSSYYTPVNGADPGNGIVSCADIGIFSRGNDVRLTMIVDSSVQPPMLPTTFQSRLLSAFPAWTTSNPRLNPSLNLDAPFPLDSVGNTYTVTLTASDSNVTTAAAMRSLFDAQATSDLSTVVGASISSKSSVIANTPDITYAVSVAFSVVALAVALIAYLIYMRTHNPNTFFGCFPCCLPLCCVKSNDATAPLVKTGIISSSAVSSSRAASPMPAAGANAV